MQTREGHEKEQAAPGQSHWDLYNEFLMQGPIDRFAKMLVRYELFRRVIELPGDIVEGGVFKGAGLFFWAKLIQIFNPLSKRRVIGFDTFEGYPQQAAHGCDAKTGERFLQEANYIPVPPETLMTTAASQQLDHRIELVKGDAALTIKEYVQCNPGFRVALLNIDFDVYEATTAALEHLYPLVVPGGVIAFDDYGVRGWGESAAVDTFLEGRSLVLKSIPWGYSPTAYFEKPS